MVMKRRNQTTMLVDISLSNEGFSYMEIIVVSTDEVKVTSRLKKRRNQSSTDGADRRLHRFSGGECRRDLISHIEMCGFTK